MLPIHRLVRIRQQRVRRIVITMPSVHPDWWPSLLAGTFAWYLIGDTYGLVNVAIYVPFVASLDLRFPTRVIKLIH